MRRRCSDCPGISRRVSRRAITEQLERRNPGWQVTGMTRILGYGLMIMAAAWLTMACSAAPAPTLTPTPEPLPDPQVLLDGAVQQIQEERYMGFVFDHPVGNTPIGPGIKLARAEGVSELPDRYRVDIVMEAQGTPLNMSIISTGEAAFLTNPISGEWAAATSPAQIPFQFEYIISLVQAMLGGISDLEMVGEEQLDGNAVYLIRGVTPTAALPQVIPGASPDTQLPVEVWVDQASGKLLKAKMTGELVPGEDPNTARVLNLESLAEPPDISAP